MLIDPLEFIKKMSAGTMTLGRASFDGRPMETCFYIKEETHYLKQLGKNPILTIQTGIFEKPNIAIVCFLMRPNGNMDMLYESWFNFHATEGLGKATFADMAGQDNIIFWFVDEKGNDYRKIEIKNSLKETFADYITKIALINPWTMQEFDQARDSLYKDYPRPENLWNKLAP